MDKCLDDFGTPERCTQLTLLTDAEINKCTQQPKVDEKTEGGCKLLVSPSVLDDSVTDVIHLL